MNRKVRLMALAVLMATAILSFGMGKSAFAGQESKSKQVGVFAALGGKWAGKLEYADFKDDSRTQLPTELEAKATNEGNSVFLNFTYGEPSGKKVTGTDVLSFDSVSGKCRFGNSEYSASGVNEFAEFAGKQSGQIVLTGRTKENDAPVDARLTIKLDGDTLTILKETRSPLKFRNQYTLKRVK